MPHEVAALLRDKTRERVGDERDELVKAAAAPRLALALQLNVSWSTRLAFGE